jgi:hypothetical protein
MKDRLVPYTAESATRSRHFGGQTKLSLESNALPIPLVHHICEQSCEDRGVPAQSQHREYHQDIIDLTLLSL